MEAQKLGKEFYFMQPPAREKTGIAAGPHLLPSSQGKVTLMVSPLLSLHDEQVSRFRDEFGLKATAINSSNGGCTKDVMQKVVADGVLRKSEFGSRCLSVFIDEAHCVSHWGASFRKKYASIGIIRAFLPRTTSIIAVTATLTPRVRQDLVTKLQFDRHTYMYRTIGNDRANVAQVIRAMEHPANSFRDLDFIVPTDNEIPEDVKLSFVYTDDIKDGGKIIDHLNARVHPNYRSRGIVRPYNAGMSREYRAHVMALFKAGIKGIRKGPPVDRVREALFLTPFSMTRPASCCHLSDPSTQSRLYNNRRLFVYIKGLNIPPLPPPPARQKQVPALPRPAPNSFTSNAPPPALLSTQAQPPSPAVTNVRKRHITALPHEAPPPAVRPRIQYAEPTPPRTPFPPPYQSFPGTTPQTPVIPRPKPKPMSSHLGIHHLRQCPQYHHLPLYYHHGSPLIPLHSHCPRRYRITRRPNTWPNTMAMLLYSPCNPPKQSICEPVLTEGAAANCASNRYASAAINAATASRFGQFTP
ncbi:hypothetical protein B0H14DRAFT_3455485 [Mycena olivaceomarginata]|nr:hypothetical protein B0H14DRAFT_3455485 [Mycena olivaceomarginata]